MSIKQTNLSFSPENEHIRMISKFSENIFGYSLKKRVFKVQSELCSSIRSKVIEVKLRHIKPKICILSELHKISYHDSKLTKKVFLTRYLRPIQDMVCLVV